MSKFFIDRPIFAWVIALVIMLVGALSILKLPINQYPAIAPTALVVGPDNKVELRQLKASRTVGSQWLIEDGLKAGDRLITEGLQFIKPGIEVKAVEASNAKPAGTAPAAAGKGE